MRRKAAFWFFDSVGFPFRIAGLEITQRLDGAIRQEFEFAGLPKAAGQLAEIAIAARRRSDGRSEFNSKALVGGLSADRKVFHGEFDSGSERTLAAWIRHASRTRIFLLAIVEKFEWRKGA